MKKKAMFSKKVITIDNFSHTDQRVRQKKPIQAVVEQNGAAFVATIASGEIDDWGEGDSPGEAAVDLAFSMEDTFIFLHGHNNKRLSASLLVQKNLLSDYFGWESWRIK